MRFKRTGSTGTAGPNLDRWLVPDARRAKLSTGLLTQRRVYWGGRGMPAYGSTLSAQELDDLVSFVTGDGFRFARRARRRRSRRCRPLRRSSPPRPRRSSAGSRASASARSRRKGRPLFAKTGCLSCHTYLGSGKRRRGAPDLSRFGRERASAVASIAAYVARPYRSGNNLMPAYADLGAGALARLGAFLAASKGPR